MTYCCDRCGLKERFIHIIGFPLDDAIYWLCASCQQAIMTEWLATHREAIDAIRIAGLRQPDGNK